MYHQLDCTKEACCVRHVFVTFDVFLFRFTSCLSFYSILNELSDFAGQREVVAEEMANRVYGELMRYSQDLKAERKHVSNEKGQLFYLSFVEHILIIRT